MTSDQKQPYSQAFNFPSFIGNGVDARTGQFTCSVALFEAPSYSRNHPPFRLSLQYNALNSRDIGFGRGWGLSLSSFEHRYDQQVLRFSTGEQYQVRSLGSNLTIQDQKLQSFRFMKAGSDYHIVHKSGVVEILTNEHNTYEISVPFKIYGAHGRSLTLHWARFGAQPRLTKIQDGDEDLLHIEYNTLSVWITRSPGTPEESILSAVLREHTVAELILPLPGSPAWQFTHSVINHIPCLTKVITPTGLVEYISYKAEGLQMPQGAPYSSIPCVITHIIIPGHGQPPISTHYQYSAQNFLGYNSGQPWNGGEDHLYHLTGEYQYSTSVRLEDGPVTKYTFNKFHLMELSEQQKGTKRVAICTKYHTLPHQSFADQPAQCQLPKTISTTYQDTSLQNCIRTETTHHAFDEWGNPTKEVLRSGVCVERVYYPAAGEINTSTGKVLCPPDPGRFQRHLKSETIKPAPSPYVAPVRTSCYTYSRLDTANDIVANHFVVPQQLEMLHDDLCHFHTEYVYIDQVARRDHGRLKQQIIHHAGQYPQTKIFTYDYPKLGEFTQTMSTQTFHENTQREVTTCSMFTGLLKTYMAHTNVLTEFRHNKIGQIVTEVVAPNTKYEAKRQYECDLLKDQAGYVVTITEAKGVQTRYSTDGLQRNILVERKDDGAQPGVRNTPIELEPFRVVREYSYNTLGKPATDVQVDWLNSDDERIQQRRCEEFHYDDWGEVCKTTKDGGLVTLSIKDPINQTRTEGIEGESQIRHRLNLFNIVTQTEVLKSDGTLNSKLDYTYDGLGRLVEKTDHLGRTMQYQLDQYDRVIQTKWPDGRTVQTYFTPHNTETWPYFK